LLQTLLETADYSAHSYASADTLVENLAALADLDFLISDIGLTHFDGKVPIHERKSR
jgi:FixJ family two-component response regulator